MELNRIRQEINARPLTDFIDLAKDKTGARYCCPICGSGTGKKGTSALTIYPNNTVYCAKGCFSGLSGTGAYKQGEDTLGALRKIWNCTEAEAIQRAGYSLHDSQGARKPAQPVKKEGDRMEQQKPTADYTAQYQEWNTLLLQAEEGKPGRDYLEGRGITDPEIIARYKLGFCPAWKPDDKPTAPATPRLIIPRTKGSYLARQTDGKGDRYEKQIQGTSEVFNLDAMDDTGKDTDATPATVITEGELDALSIIQAGYSRVLALGSTSNKGRALEAIRKRNPGGVYIIALDDDTEGQKAQEWLHSELDRAGVLNISADVKTLYGGHKDANERLQADGAEALIIPLMPIIADAWQKVADKKKTLAREAEARGGAGMVDSFLQAITSERYKPFSTGFRSIDRALNGGLARQTLVMIAGAPAIGKTALISEMAERMATGDRELDNDPKDCLYINLEMSREQMLARSLSRIARTQPGGEWADATAILRGYEWINDADKKEVVNRVASIYKATIARHLVYNPDALPDDRLAGESPRDLSVILAKMEAEKQRLGHSPDIIIIDYLQLVTSKDDAGRADNPIDTIRKTVSALKDYAIENNCVVICATATNRESNKTGNADITSGRDTSNIEFSADVHIGLVYRAIEDGLEITIPTLDGDTETKTATLADIKRLKRLYYERPDDREIADAYNRYTTEIVAKVNKNRFGMEEARAILHFDGAFASYSEIDTAHSEPPHFTEIKGNGEPLPF